MPKLTILTGKHRGKKLALPDKELTIGRDKSCDITLNTDEVSRRHAVLRVKGEEATIRDLGSRNGTIVNQVRIEEETRLTPGDELRLGPMHFRFDVKSAKTLDASSAEGESTEKVEIHEATEDSINDWLADQGPEESSSGDTTIIATSVDTDTDVHPTSAPESAPAPAVPPPAKRDFDSVAEEAQDIIRRHMEMKSAQ